MESLTFKPWLLFAKRKKKFYNKDLIGNINKYARVNELQTNAKHFYTNHAELKHIVRKKYKNRINCMDDLATLPKKLIKIIE